MWLPRRWLKAEKAIQDIYKRLEILGSAQVAGVDPSQFKSLEGKLGAFLGQLADLREGIDADAFGREEIRRRLDDLGARLDHQTLAISDGIERTTRAENRINNTVQRARAQLKKRGVVDAGLEAEDREIRRDDADRGDENGVRSLSDGLERDDETPSSVPGITVAQLRRFRGLS